MCVIGKSVGSHAVRTQYEVYAFGLRLFDDIESQLQFVVFADRVTDLAALGFGKSISHTAAQNQVVHLVHQVFDDADFGRNLRAAHDGRERTFDVAQYVVYGVHFFLHQIAEHLVVGIEIVGDDSRRGMFAVSRSERVVYVAVRV